LANAAAEYNISDYEQSKTAGMIVEVDPSDLIDNYVNDYIIPTMKKIGAWADIIRYMKENPEFQVIVDPMQGTGVRYLDAIYTAIGAEVGRPIHRMIHTNNLDPEFTEVKGSPKPDDANSRVDLENEVKARTRAIGLSTDGDADRFGNVDFDGTFISADDMIGLLTYFLVSETDIEGNAVGKTVATNDFSNEIVKYLNREREETGKPPIEMIEVDVGFKWIVEQAVKYNKKFIVGGEESAHVGVGPFMRTWDDGIVVGLMSLWLVTKSGMGFSEYKANIERTIGVRFKKSVADVPATAEEKKSLAVGAARIAQEIVATPQLSDVSVVKEIESAQGQKVAKIIPVIGGLKIVFESGDNLLMRPSGTQDIIKYYVGLIGKDGVVIDAARGAALIEVGKAIVKTLASSPITEKEGMTVQDELAALANEMAEYSEDPYVSTVKSEELAETISQRINELDPNKDLGSSPVVDENKEVGGINLNPALLDLQIKRDGNGVPLPVNLQPIQQMHIDGFIPIIIHVTPVVNLPQMLGFAEGEVPTNSEDADAQTTPHLSLIDKYRNQYVQEDRRKESDMSIV
jgi:phosphomannomutase